MVARSHLKVEVWIGVGLRCGIQQGVTKDMSAHTHDRATVGGSMALLHSNETATIYDAAS